MYVQFWYFEINQPFLTIRSNRLDFLIDENAYNSTKKEHSNKKSNLSLYSLYYAEASNELRGPSPALLRPGNTCFFRRNVAAVASRWQHCVRFYCQRFEPQTSRSKDERVTARPWKVNLEKTMYRLPATLIACIRRRYSGSQFVLSRPLKLNNQLKLNTHYVYPTTDTIFHNFQCIPKFTKQVSAKFQYFDKHLL